MRTLITGATGFVGAHLSECLLAAGDDVHGLARQAARPAELSHLAERLPLHVADLLDNDRLAELLADLRPDRIAHLAGFADAGASFRDQDAAWAGNLTATRNLYATLSRGAVFRRGYCLSPLVRFMDRPFHRIDRWTSSLRCGPSARMPRAKPRPIC